MGWFSRFSAPAAGSSSPTPPPASPPAAGAANAGKQHASDDAEAAALLQQAEQALNQLRVASGEDFPLLNQATRLVQAVDGCVAGMRDGEGRLAWRRWERRDGLTANETCCAAPL